MPSIYLAKQQSFFTFAIRKEGNRLMKETSMPENNSIFIKGARINNLKNIDVEIPTTVRDNVIITSFRVVELAERGINVPFYNIVEMKNILLENKNAQVNIQENAQVNTQVNVQDNKGEMKYDSKTKRNR